MIAIQGVYDGKMIRPLEPFRSHPNAKVIITFLDEEPTESLPTTRLEDVAGCLKFSGPAKTLSDMDDAIRRGVAKRWK